jgi:ssDNA-binding Zn-finger/Zn-ribbon topoisomerase 1
MEENKSIPVPKIHCQNCRSDRTFPEVLKIKLSEYRYSIICNKCNEWLKIIEPDIGRRFIARYGVPEGEVAIPAKPPTVEMQPIDLSALNPAVSNPTGIMHDGGQGGTSQPIPVVANATPQDPLAELQKAENEIKAQLKKIEELKAKLTSK